MKKKKNWTIVLDKGHNHSPSGKCTDVALIKTLWSIKASDGFLKWHGHSRFPNDRILLPYNSRIVRVNIGIKRILLDWLGWFWEESHHTSRGFCLYSAVHAVCLEVGHPSIHQSRFEDLPAVEILSGPMVIPQVIHRLHMILLLSGEDGVECLQLQQKRAAERQRKKNII